MKNEIAAMNFHPMVYEIS